MTGQTLLYPLGGVRYADSALSIYRGGMHMKNTFLKISRNGRLPITVLTALLLTFLLCPAALADTDGTEPKIVQQPDQLVLQLGNRWAGVEFELRTDAGVFPAPVVVDETGVLTMDLGGSTTYTLSCINSTVSIPGPVPEQTEQPEAPEVPETTPPAADPVEPPAAEQSGAGVPLPAVIFLVGLIAAIAVLATLYITKKRREANYDEWDDGEEYP